jgi:uncharacterized protein (TIGR02001 family)
MRESILSAALAAALLVPLVSHAQSALPVLGNVALASEYRFRGIDQTFGQPALQAGVDYSHPSGLYLSNWNSNVHPGAGFPNANLEMDLYGGWKRRYGDFGVDLGAIYYFYPGSDPRTDNKELYLGGSWRTVSLKYFHSLGDYFDISGTKNSTYVDLSAILDVGSGWGVVAHFGTLRMRHRAEGDYDDWKLGLTKDLGGYVFGASYVDTNAQGACGAPEFYCAADSTGSTKDLGRATIVLSVSKTF